MRKPAVAVSVLALLLAGTAIASNTDSAAFSINKRIGDIVAGESEAHVTYDYGATCLAGCAGRNDGCVLGISRCVGTMYRYEVDGGYLRVGYRERDARGKRIPGRVVYLETNSAVYRAADDLGVGTKIAYGSRYGPFRLLLCGPGEREWTAGTSWRKPLWKYGRHRWWTRLYMDRGIVKVIAIYRGDVNLQGC
jgi:hypothetical protein